MYFGSEPEGREALAPAFELGHSFAAVSMISWNEVFLKAGFGSDAIFCQPGQIHDMYTVNVRNLSASTMQSAFIKMSQFYETNPAARSSVIILETFPIQATTSIRDDATAYSWRDTTGYM